MSKVDTEQNTHACESISQLIPWFVNDTLSAIEKARVSRHLHDCTHCQQTLTLSEMICTSAQDDYSQFDQASNHSTPQSPPSSLMSRIDQYEKDGAVDTKDDVPATKNNIHTFSFTHLPRALAASVVVCFVLGGSVLFNPQGIFPRATPNSSNESLYHTLSDSSGPADSSAQPVREVNQYKVLFKKNTAPEKIESVIKKTSASVIVGPSSRGVYTLQFSSSNDMLPILRSEDSILVAEPATK